MNFNKTGLPSSNTSYKIGHICETLARTLRTIPQFLSSFWINNPEQHKPERLFLSSYASKRKKKPFAIHDYTAEHDYNADKVAMMGSSSSGTAG